MNGTHEEVSGYTISTGFCGLMGDQRTPEYWGVTENIFILFVENSSKKQNYENHLYFSTNSSSYCNMHNILKLYINPVLT